MSSTTNATPDRSQLRAHRQILWAAWLRAQQSLPLDPLQRRIVQVIYLHPEYHYLFNDEETFLDQAINPGAGNPYLHLSLHLAIEEQLALNQPMEITAWLTHALKQKKIDRHAAVHAVVEILGGIMFDAEQGHNEPNTEAYIQRINALIHS